MDRLTAMVKGKVQKVGYRDTVQEIARQLGITGYVQNIKPYDVKIVAEGEEFELKDFLEQINVQKYPVLVENISVEWSKASGEFEYFEIVRGDWEDELFERLDFAGSLLFSINNKQDTLLGKQDAMLDKQDAMLDKQDAMLDKQDAMLDKQDAMLEKEDKALEKQDTMLSNQNKMLNKQDETIGEIRSNKQEITLTREDLKNEVRMTREGLTKEVRNSTSELKGEIRGLREGFKSHTEERFNKIEKDIGEIKDRLGMNS